MNRRSLLAVVPGIASVAITSSGIFAQAYPSRSDSADCPVVPGGRMTSLLGFGRENAQFGAFVVENRSGAGTIIEPSRSRAERRMVIFSCLAARTRMFCSHSRPAR